MRSTLQAEPKATLALQTEELRRNLQTPISTVRAALEQRISLRFPHFQGFLTEYSSNLSISGLFVRSPEPRQPGTLLDLEFTLTDGLKLIRGTGEVVWARQRDEGPRLLAGMGIRFLRLDTESRRLIRWAVEKQVYDGVQPFDLRAAGDRPPTDTPESESLIGQRPARDELSAPQPGAEGPEARKLRAGAGHASLRRPRSKRHLSTAASVLVSVTLVAWALYVWYSSGGSPAFADVRSASLPGAAPAPPPDAARGRPVPSKAASDSIEAEKAAAQAADAAPGEPPTRNGNELLVAVTEAWARAWAAQRPEDYLSLYSRDFQPPGSMPRDAWEALRTRRITEPSFIRVGISRLDVERLAPDEARVRFDQAYRSDGYLDFTRKTLDLVREDGAWKIRAERAE